MTLPSAASSFLFSVLKFHAHFQACFVALKMSRCDVAFAQLSSSLTFCVTYRCNSDCFNAALIVIQSGLSVDITEGFTQLHAKTPAICNKSEICTQQKSTRRDHTRICRGSNLLGGVAQNLGRHHSVSDWPANLIKLCQSPSMGTRKGIIPLRHSFFL